MENQWQSNLCLMQDVIGSWIYQTPYAGMYIAHSFQENSFHLDAYQLMIIVYKFASDWYRALL